MDIDLVHRYLCDARRAYHSCAIGLGLPDSEADLAALLRAARKRLIERRGKVQTQSGGDFDYHIHGAGYTFKDLESGKELHFDVVATAGEPRIRFSAWDVFRYAQSIGKAITEAAVAEELRQLIVSEPDIAHVREGHFEYYTTEGLPCGESGLTSRNENHPITEPPNHP